VDKEYKKNRVYRVFEKISQHYDGANYRISFGLQTSWKKMLTSQLIQKSPKDEKILDLCCGTGDIAIEIAKKRPDLQLIGADFSPAMLKVAKQKSCGMKNILWEKEDATKLSFGENQFAMATISFGLRNTSDYRQVLSEMLRVVKPGGHIYCLDSFVPDNALVRPFHQIYFRYMMPLIGGGKAYREEYLWLYQSTRQFLRRKELISLCEEIGLTEIQYRKRMFGACVLIEGRKIEEKI